MTTSPLCVPSAAHDFDFLIGSWTSRQRRLKHRLQGCDDWETFTASSTVQPLPGGVGNVDALAAEAWRAGWVGLSLRIFNPVTQLWSIHWVTNDGGGIDAASGRLQAPLVGRFESDVGLFEGSDEVAGQAVRVQFRWQRLGADAARWEQAFSADGGHSWEVNWVMEFERESATTPNVAQVTAAPEAACDVIELRQYTLHPGRRDELIDLFDRAFVETQEAAGMTVLGQFRDLEADDRFVWLRGFVDMDRRASALASFYGGPVWQQHRNAANATMIDSDDVLLLRPAWPGAGIDMRGRHRPTGAVRLSRPGLLHLCVLPLHGQPDEALLRLCREQVTACLEQGGGAVLGWYVTHEVANNFPQLPVREDVTVLVAAAMFDSMDAHERFVTSASWTGQVLPALAARLAAPMHHLRLVATARSALHA